MTEKQQELTQMGISDCAMKTRLVDLGIKAVDKTILCALCSHIYKDTSDGYWCNPSHALLESETGYKSRKITDSVGVLKELGYIRVIATKYSNKYFINAVKIVEAHNLWRNHFSDKEKSDNPYGVVSKSAIESFNNVKNKVQPNKSQAGLVQNQNKQPEAAKDIEKKPPLPIVDTEEDPFGAGVTNKYEPPKKSLPKNPDGSSPYWPNGERRYSYDDSMSKLEDDPDCPF